MKTIFLSLFLLIYLQPVIAQEENTVQDVSDTGDAASSHEHRLIAILPFRMTSPEVKYSGGTSLEKLTEEEKIFSMQVQQAFYNSITNDQEHWLVSVQDCRVTDSLLERAGIDLQKAGYVDRQILARLLKVDAVVTGQLDNFRSMHKSPGAQILGTANIPYRVGKLFLSLFDGETGELIWTFKRNARTDQLIGNFYRLDPELYNAFRRKFPYTR